MRSKYGLLLSVAVLSLTGVACGGDGGDVATADRENVVEVKMEDTRFVPDRVELRKGEAVVFRFANGGTVRHEAVFGTQAEQDRHAGEMTEQPHGMDHASSPTSADSTMSDSMPVMNVDPGETAELPYTAPASGEILIGCHEPGHWEAGMKATVTLT
jgi:uncharacterized cupredoxin-like copper-binding protein